MGVPSRLQSIAEVVVVCRFWKPVRIPDRRGWVNRYGLCECTRLILCEYNTPDSRVGRDLAVAQRPHLGGCIIDGNVFKVPREKKP